ncbi:MAG: M56 family metallopeptidase [Chitinophagaceae bacterium]|nr:M56 family metallopeptidase [Chitinophagaceae bacterium]MCW5928151.1 M56 family metallopeptidase [Chitinophagaceae bacterium]
MTALYHSPFLLALGWAIAASLWQAAILWLFYQLIANRQTSPVFKHNLSLLFLSISTCWFGYTFIQKYNEFATAYISLDFTGAVAESNRFGLLAFVQNSILPLLNQYLPYFSAAYLIILLLLTIRLINAYSISRKLQTQGLIPMEINWIERVERYAANIGIYQQVRIYLSEYIDVPATLNYFKPVILLPVAVFNQLTPEQVESVILHEMAHIKRKDYLVNILVSVVEILLFFNPFIHLLITSLRKERENCCDDFVLRYRVDPHSYASALLSLEQMRIKKVPATVLAATGNDRQLLVRVKRIMNIKNSNLNYGQRLLALFIIAFMLISIAWLSPEKSQGNPEEEITVVEGPESGQDSGVEKEPETVAPLSKPADKPFPKVVPGITIAPDDIATVNGDISRLLEAVPPVPPSPPSPPAYATEEYFAPGMETEYELFNRLQFESGTDELFFIDAPTAELFGRVAVPGFADVHINIEKHNTKAPKAGSISLRGIFDTILVKNAQAWRASGGQLQADKQQAQLRKLQQEADSWTFIYDSVFGNMQLDAYRKAILLERQRKTLRQKADTISPRTVKPAKAKKTIWVNNTHENQSGFFYAVNLTGNDIITHSAGISNEPVQRKTTMIAEVVIDKAELRIVAYN